MPTEDPSIEARYKASHTKRQRILRRAVRCAALSKPWVLPDSNQTADDELPENYQSLGSRGATNTEGKMLFALFPPTAPFFQLALAPEIMYSPEVPDEAKAAMLQHLGMRELMIMSVLESRQLRKGKDNRPRRAGFRSRKRAVLSQLIITGDVLEMLTDEYTLKVFRRDQYITRRDSAGDILFHIIEEEMDALSLPPERFAKSGLNRTEMRAKVVSERMVKIYTLVEWQPESHEWLIEQEINKHVTDRKIEQITPFFATPFELAPGENYGRGLIEQNFGDLRTLDTGRLRLVEGLAMATKYTPVIDSASIILPKDLEKATGVPIFGRVRDGKVVDVAFLAPDNIPQLDWGSRFLSTDIQQPLGEALLLESATQPKGERVTAYQVQRIAMELEGQLGGVYSGIADMQQLPLLDRTIYQLERDLLMPTLDEDAVQVRMLTGIEALSREIDAAKIMEIVQLIAALGPEAAGKINVGVLVDTMVRKKGFYEPNLIKTDEQVAAEQQAAQEQAVQAAAAQKAIDVTGNVAEAQMTQGEPTNG